MRILVAEYNKISQIVALQMLRRMGHQADAASDGEAAVRQVQMHRYDLVLMDVQMPGMDGLEATRRIRALPLACSRVPIIALTASATIEDRDACFESGMNSYISKPLSAEALGDLMDRWDPREQISGQLLPSCSADECSTEFGTQERTVLATRRPDAPLICGLNPSPEGRAVIPFNDVGNSTRTIDEDALDWVLPDHLRRLASVDPSIVSDLIESYIADTAERLQRLKTALQRDDLACVSQEAHSLIGASSQMGAGNIPRICRVVESAASHDVPEIVRAWVTELERLFEGMSPAMQAYAALHRPIGYSSRPQERHQASA
jgi:CheY-like chemotaxis protein